MATTDDDQLARTAMKTMLGIVVAGATAVAATAIFAPTTAYDTLIACAAKGEVTHKGVTFICEVKK